MKDTKAAEDYLSNKGIYFIKIVYKNKHGKPDEILNPQETQELFTAFVASELDRKLPSKDEINSGRNTEYIAGANWIINKLKSD